LKEQDDFLINIKLVYVILELSGLDVLPSRVLKH